MRFILRREFRNLVYTRIVREIELELLRQCSAIPKGVINKEKKNPR